LIKHEQSQRLGLSKVERIQTISFSAVNIYSKMSGHWSCQRTCFLCRLRHSGRHPELIPRGSGDEAS